MMERQSGMASGRLAPVLDVLIVYDDEEYCELLELCLGGLGHRVECIGRGREGLARFQRETFDLVIVGHRLPEMSGEELAVAIKRLMPGTPVIMVVGADIKALPVGVDVLLFKPFGLDRICQAIRQATSMVNQ